ncbi:MAG: MFS transporter [Hydrococcus sp. C42_A2020_068]|uniref:MFS transporter n=1 Tax=Pleurocapsa sp. PCC 7327 TaxID=118163 RepID=UPI00029F9EE3|nr:MFS transporter [Pleurocapsa sp. PCC 7327]AFY78801.1 Na+/melibiose symporter-like transporter [Pleurocapsa sp. PCC 7327]MBF2020175.1 MFS transporter [Hydrococcus sp. C42_A2020_068]
MSGISPSEASSAIVPKSEKLKFSTKLTYGAGDLGPAITANILVFYLLFFFTDVAGLPAGLASSILMIGKIADAINDPIVGIMSDRTRSRWGRRLPWMLFGAVPFGIIYYLQWIIPHFSSDRAANQWWLFGYYVLIGILFNIAYTMVNLPYTALTPELTQDYNERTSLNSFRFAFSIGGSILSLILYILIIDSYAENPAQGYEVLGILCGVVSVVAILWCTLRIQERGADPILNQRQKKLLGILLIAIGSGFGFCGIDRLISTSGGVDYQNISAGLLSVLIIAFGITLLFANPESHLIDDDAARQLEAQQAPSIPFKEQLQIVFTNKPFLFVIGIYLCSWLAVQLTASILVYFVVSWMRLPEQQSGMVALAVQGTALVMLFFWQTVSKKFDKKVVYFMGMSLWIVAQVLLFMLQPSQAGLMYFGAIMAGFGVSVAYLIPWSMIPDVIELDELKTGKRREGVFYAFMVLLQKFGLALGLFLVGIALEAAGFIEREAGQPIPIQPETALWAIRLAIGPLPALFLIGGLILAYFYPITREVHAEIRLKLQERYRDGTTPSESDLLE